MLQSSRAFDAREAARITRADATKGLASVVRRATPLAVSADGLAVSVVFPENGPNEASDLRF